MNKKSALIGLFIITALASGCVQQEPASNTETHKQPPEEIPKGILVKEVPQNADIIFTSVRYVLQDSSCLDENYELKENFITDPGCNREIYAPGGRLALPRQLFTIDLETGQVVQLTNNNCFFITAQVIDSTAIVALAACSDTDNNGLVDEQDEAELYLLDLTQGTMTSLTDDYELAAINNPDYSSVTRKIVFSAQKDGVFHNHLYTVDANKTLVQMTDDEDFMDFDCAWSEDGSKIIFNRLPLPIFSKPSQVWMMDAAGTNPVKLTDGGTDSNNEGTAGVYPIGTDADPDMSPDNSQVVFSRLKTGKQNEPIGIWELVIIDISTGEETVVDSQYANMLPEWKSRGIIFVRQQSTPEYQAHPMDVKQSLYWYNDGKFTELEQYPYNVFPIGAFGASWIN